MTGVTPETVLWMLGLGITSFSVTNIDDLFVLAMFFSNPAFTVRQVVIGQYIGISLLVAISLVSYFVALLIPTPWIGLMGFLPIYIGVKHMLQLKASPEKTGAPMTETKAAPTSAYTHPPQTENTYPLQTENTYPTQTDAGRLAKYINPNIVSVATVTFANGGDNIGVYVPLFAGSSALQLVILVLVFLVMVAVWCVLGYYLVNNAIAGEQIKKYGPRLLPFFLIGLGVFILYNCKSYTLLL